MSGNNQKVVQGKELVRSLASDEALVELITTALRAPGVKVSREQFLSDIFAKTHPDGTGRFDTLSSILAEGPVRAGCERGELKRIAKNLVNKRTLESSAVSFAAGLPGGAAAAVAIPADVLQFYGVALRLAQEISYLYGAEDLWKDNAIDQERITNTFVIYLGVMLGASGAAATLKASAAALAKQAVKKLPQKALTKTFYYPIVKSIAKYFGKNMTKQVFAKGVSKTIPVIGGVASGGLTFATMRPMGTRLANCFDEALFDYSDKDAESDINEIQQVIASEMDSMEENAQSSCAVEEPADSVAPLESMAADIARAKSMLDTGLITEEEFSEIKAKLIAKL